MPTKEVLLEKTTTLPNRYQYKSYKNESLFEHAPWAYAFCREHLFRDDTRRIITALWPDEHPALESAFGTFQSPEWIVPQDKYSGPASELRRCS